MVWQQQSAGRIGACQKTSARFGKVVLLRVLRQQRRYGSKEARLEDEHRDNERKEAAHLDETPDA